MSVADFFNRLAPSYRQRLDRQQAPWLAYWFGKRFELAAATLNKPGQRILDVGCGTGGFLDYLQEHDFLIEYWGCDIAEEMLKHSSIPAARQILGSPLDDTFPSLPFDSIVVLGVSSYWTADYLRRLLERLTPFLEPANGQLIISFTYSQSWDYQIRCRLQPLLARLGWTQRVISQPIFATTPAAVQTLLPAELQVIDCHWLPGTLPLLPSISPRLACWLSQRFPYPPPFSLRTDFLVKLALRPHN